MASNLTQKELEAEMAALILVLDQARRIGMQKAESLIKQRGIADLREVARIRARDGADAVTTLDQTEALMVTGSRTAQIRADLSASDFAARLKPEVTSVIGRIIGDGGLPAAGFRLRVSTESGAAVADAVVDASGLFAVDMPRAEFDRCVGKSPLLNVAILDAKGATVRQSQFPFRPGKEVLVWNFDLGAEPSPSAPVHTPCPPAATLEDVKGLRPNHITKLKSAGIGDVASLAKSKAEEIAKLLKITADQAQQIIQYAGELDAG